MLKISDLHTYYGVIHALKGINIEVEKGEIVSLIGSNGAGKTTLLNSVMGVCKSSKGKITFKDKDITNISTYKLSKLGIGISPEGREVFPELSVEENLRLGAYTVSSKNDISTAYERVYKLFPRLKERYKQSAGTLSGGEQQRVAIARSLITRPAIILADEPTGNLDRKNSEEISSLFRLVNKRFKSTIIIITHDEKVANSCDRVYKMVDGKLNRIEG